MYMERKIVDNVSEGKLVSDNVVNAGNVIISCQL